VRVRPVVIQLRGPIVFFLLLLGSPAAAQQAVPEEPTQADEAQGEAETRLVYWEDGLRLRTRKLRFRAKIGGQAQNDSARFHADGSQPVELDGGVEWRRARLYMSGSFGRIWSFKFQWDFAGGRGPNLADAWLGLDFKLWRRQLRLRSGRFSSTFGLENESSSNDSLFMEQGLTSAFVPPQETGVLVHSESDRRRWDFSFSSSAGELDCIICSVVGVTGRYGTSFTFGREDRRLHLGVDASRRWPDKAVDLAARPESHLAPVFVATGPIPADAVTTGLAEGAYLDGPFSIQSEYAIARLSRAEGAPPLFHAFYVAAAWSLTGESRPYHTTAGTIGRLQPRRPVGEPGGIGAIELALRYSHIDLEDREITGGKLSDASLAVNWYPSRPTRASFNVIRADRAGWAPVWIFQGRFQLAF